VPTIELSIYPLLAPLLCIRPRRSNIQELNIVRQYIIPTLSITNPPDFHQAGLALVEVFAYVSFVVILLADADQHRAIGLLGFLGDLIPGAVAL
jgi:hypothetical protein